MAISWGSWDENFRVGVETTVSSVTTSSTSVTWTTKWYVEAQYNVNDEMTVSFGGSLSGSSTQNLTCGSSGCYKLWATKTYTYTYSTYGSSPGTRTFSGSLSGVYNGATPSKSVTVTIPARPYAGPTQPDNVTTTRNSDAQATVNWTRVVTAQRPYTSLTVQMRTYTGGTWGAWATVATTSSTATSYVKTGLVANRGYQFQVRSNNSVGSSNFVAATAIYMTPAAPTNVASVLNPSGTSITTSWTSAAFESANHTWTVQRSVNGGAYATVASGLGTVTRSWTDPTPGAGTNRYRVAVTHQSLTSAYTEGNTLTTIIAPLAPTLLSPNGTPRDFARSQVFSWQHNHGGDGAPQSHFTIEYSTNGGSSWTPLVTDVASAVSSYTVPADTFANGTTFLWRVRTEGIVSAGYGPNSAATTVTGSTTPTATITAPGATVNFLPLVVTWDYNQDESSPQASWQANLYAGDGTTLLQSMAGSGTAGTATFSYPLVDGASYVVRVRVQSGAGLWGDWSEVSFDFVLLPPALGHVEPEWQPCTGTMVLHLTADDVTPGETVTAVWVSVDRRINGGDWVNVATEVPIPNDLLDLLPVTNGLNEYRVTSASASPSYNVGDPVPMQVNDNEHLWTFLNWGESFAQVLRFHGDPSTSHSANRVGTEQDFLGRPKPMALFGENTSQVISTGGSLHYDATCALPDIDGCTFDSPPADWIEAGTNAEVVCFRDYTGRRIFGRLSTAPNITDELWPSFAKITFGVTQVNYVEAGGFIDVDDIDPDSEIMYVLDGGDPWSSGTDVADGGTP